MPQPNYIYYDLIQTNLENNNSDAPLCAFNERRNQEFLKNPEEYKFSIVRFMIDTPSLPIFRPIIQYTEDVNLTVYSITLKKNTATSTDGVYSSSDVSQQYIQWTPQDITISEPKSPVKNSNGLQDNSTGYYNCYQYAFFLKLINNAFETASSDLGISNAPTILFDSASNLFVLSAPKDNYDTSLTTYWEIYMNKSLYQLFSSFPAINTSHIQNYGLNYKIFTNNFKGFSTTSVYTDTLGADTESLMVYGEYSTLYLWNCVTSIVFTSSNLPVVASNTSK